MSTYFTHTREWSLIYLFSRWKNENDLIGNYQVGWWTGCIYVTYSCSGHVQCAVRGRGIYTAHTHCWKRKIGFFVFVLFWLGITSGRRKICQNNDVIEIYCIVFLSPSFRCCLLQIMKINWLNWHNLCFLFQSW